MRKKKNLQLCFKEVARYDKNWATLTGLLSDDDSAWLNSLKECDPAGCDLVYRISTPFNFKEIKTKTAIFITSEFKVLLPQQYNTLDDFRACINQPQVKIVTPSNWSAEGFYRQGCGTDQVLVVPHGVDTTVFGRSEASRLQTRTNLGLDGFVFLHIGAMTECKGVDLLLQAFATVAAQRPDARLILKGNDGLYPSNEFLKKALSGLPVEAQTMVLDRLSYIGNSLSMADMARIYQSADAYLSPYKAEGFNMPVLEAMACGLPVICTRGGATDDFVDDDCALRIDSRLITVGKDDYTGDMLLPDLDHLIQLMYKVMDDADWRCRAAEAGIERVHRSYTWDAVTDLLLEKLLGE